jgi:uncharacterized lipoprotein YehR (DUF1307 family)
MKRLLALCVVLVIAVIILGYFRDWFSFTSTSDDRKVKINVTVDKDKVKEDEERAKEKIQNLGSQIKEEADKIRKK